MERVDKLGENSGSVIEEPLRRKCKRGTMKEKMKRLIEAMEDQVEILDKIYDDM